MVHYEIECENVFTEKPEKVDLYFHLTEAELTMLNLGTNEAYSKFTDEGTGSSQKVEMFQKLIKLAYGQKADNGQFVKNETARDAFLCSPAYSVFLMKIITGEINVQEFILGCMPKNISKKVQIDSDGKVSMKE